MFDSDVSYLYSNEFLTLSSSNRKELCTRVSNCFQCRPIRTHVIQKPEPTLEIRHRTKHILLFRREAIEHDKRRGKMRTLAQLLKEKCHLFEENLLVKLQELADEQSPVENDPLRFALQKKFETKLDNNDSIDLIRELKLTDRRQIPVYLDPYWGRF